MVFVGIRNGEFIHRHGIDYQLIHILLNSIVISCRLVALFFSLFWF